MLFISMRKPRKESYIMKVMKEIKIRWTMTNTEILNTVKSLVMKKADFDTLDYREAGDLLYALGDAVKQILMETQGIKYSWNEYGEEDTLYRLEMGCFNFVLALKNTDGLIFERYHVKIVK